MKYFSTFSGIGGFEYGILKAISHAKCVGYSEFDKYPAVMYSHNFPEHKNYGDITKIDFNKLPDFDLLVGGAPCQSHSRIGNKLGFDDPRGQLFFDYVKLIKTKQPKAFIFENVKDLATGDGGKNLELVLQSFLEAGYKTFNKILKASHYGIPQDRERLFVVGIRNDIDFNYKFPNAIPLEKSFKDFLDGPNEWDRSLFWKSSSLAYLQHAYGEGKKEREKISMGLHQEADRPCARTIVANIHKGLPADCIIDRTLCKYGAWDCEFAGSDEGWCDDCESMSNFSESVYGCPAGRKFSFRELERLFGFPEGSSDVPGLSNGRKKKGFGNSVVVNVVEAVVNNLKPIF